MMYYKVYLISCLRALSYFNTWYAANC